MSPDDDVRVWRALTFLFVHKKWHISPDMENVISVLVALLPHSGKGGVCPEVPGGIRLPELAAVGL